MYYRHVITRTKKIGKISKKLIQKWPDIILSIKDRLDSLFSYQKRSVPSIRKLT